MRRRLAAAAVTALLPVPVETEARPRAGVAALQVALRAHGLYSGDIDGIKGPGTRAGVRRFQARRGLAVDGIAGPATRRALGRRGRPRYGHRVMRSGTSGWDVAMLQFILGRKGFPSGTFDGGFGPRVEAAVRRFQAWAGIAADGVVGPGTRAALRRPRPRTSLRFYRPAAGPVGDRFGPRGDRFHSGLDFPLPYGARVQAAGRGCVTTAGYDAGGYGNLVVIQHRFGVSSWYAHLGTITVRRGECLVGGTRVGTVGSTGFSTGPHLHFELRVRGAVIDPMRAFL
jgi:peptidoglycan hydrolase-like protein with peptidoglycan-binding domain